jgi:hypothetical protein
LEIDPEHHPLEPSDRISALNFPDQVNPHQAQDIAASGLVVRDEKRNFDWQVDEIGGIHGRI